MSSGYPYALKGTALDSTYSLCLEKGLDITIKYLIEVFRGSLSMGYIPIPRRHVQVVFIHEPCKKPNQAKLYHPLQASYPLRSRPQKGYWYSIVEDVVQVLPYIPLSINTYGGTEIPVFQRCVAGMIVRAVRIISTQHHIQCRPNIVLES